MTIIKGSRINTSKGIHVCIGKWFQGGKPSLYEFIKEYEEPMATDILIIKAELIDKMLKEKKIQIL
jgi:hypothetical protein